MDITKLNDKQKQAIIHINGPMLVLAGAGSGKTKVLTSRVAYLIENGISPENILAITFTNKAANEMKDRVYKEIGKDAYKIQISTFHSFGLKILKENYELLGYDKNFIIIDSDDVLTIIKKLIKENDLNPKYYSAREIRNKISNCKNELLTVNDFEKREYDKNIVTIYRKYNELLKANNSVDFDDLLMLPIKLFKEHTEVLDRYREIYKYILIDEYQDTNEAQYIFTKMLAEKYKNIFVVGDNDQAIYAFRGANFKNILNFEKDYKGCKVVLLEENYRSTGNILAAANSVIKNNKERKEKNLWTSNEFGDKVNYKKCDSDREECSYVSETIKNLRVNDNASYEDIAIIYRTNAQSRLIEEQMLKCGIPYKIVGSFYFYNRKEIKDLLSYLRLIANPKDDISLLRAINTPKRGIGEKTIQKLTNKAIDNNISIFEAIEDGKELLFKNLIINMIKKSNNMSLTEITDMLLKSSGIREELLKEKSLENDIRLENLEEFKSITKSYEEDNGVISLDEFLNEITLVSDMSEHQDGEDKVTLMTIHSVKGLEYDNVFVIGLEEEIFPHYNALRQGTNSALEEERRLCYVAITRAKKRLYLSSAKKRLLFGSYSCNLPSRFIDEIDDKYIIKDEGESGIIKVGNKISSFVKKNIINDNIELKKGDHVSHEKFGQGIIIEIDKSIMTIAFANPIGIKKMMKNHKSIKKI